MWAYSQDLRARIVKAVKEEGLSQSEVARRFSGLKVTAETRGSVDEALPVVACFPCLCVVHEHVPVDAQAADYGVPLGEGGAARFGQVC